MLFTKCKCGMHAASFKHSLLSVDVDG